MTKQMPSNGWQGAPTAPRPPVKKGLPGWALALIIVGGVLFIGFVVAAVVVASLILNAMNQQDCSAPGSCGQVAPHSPTEDWPDDSTTTPDNSGESTDWIPLDEVADFGGPAIWTVSVLDGWDVVTFDLGGINSFENKQTGCVFVTSQNAMTVDPTVTSDRAASEELIRQLTQNLSDSATSTVELGTGAIDVAVGSAESGATVEFLTTALEQELPQGTRVVEILARRMPASGGFMWAQLSCDASIYNSGESPFTELVAGLSAGPDY